MLVRFLFILIPVSMGGWGVWAECEPHSSCPPLIPSLAKYKAKHPGGLAASPNHMETLLAGRDRVPMEITAPDLEFSP